MDERYAIGGFRFPDGRMPVDVSLDLLDALHARWFELLERLDESTWRRACASAGTRAQRLVEANLDSAVPIRDGNCALVPTVR